MSLFPVLLLMIQSAVFFLTCTKSPMDYIGYIIGLEALFFILLFSYRPIRMWLEEHEDRIDKRFFVARNPQTPVSMLERFSKDRVSAVRKAVAWNYRTPAYILKHLAQDKNPAVRRAVAENPAMPLPFLEDISTLKDLAKDRDPEVRFTMANNGSPKMPVVILEHLAKDRDPDVRFAVARNKRTPDYVLAMLAKDKNRNVRLEVANNKRTPDYILDEILSKDKDWEISLAVLKRESSRT